MSAHDCLWILSGLKNVTAPLRNQVRNVAYPLWNQHHAVCFHHAHISAVFTLPLELGCAQLQNSCDPLIACGSSWGLWSQIKSAVNVCLCLCLCVCMRVLFFIYFFVVSPWWAVNITKSLKQMAPCWKTDVILHRTDHEYGCHISSWHPRPQSWLAASPLFETTPRNLALEFWHLVPSWPCSWCCRQKMHSGCADK